MSNPAFKTADLCDAHSDVQIAEPLLRDFGGHITFYGPIATIKVFEDNSLVRSQLEQPGAGRVLVVDGGGSLRCALLGDQLALLGVKNGWAGLVINGCVRDSADLASMALGVKALATHPLKSIKRGIGEQGQSVRFAGVHFFEGEYLYADHDGIVLARQALL